MDQGRVSVSYARALLDWATGANLAPVVYTQSEALVHLIDNNPEFGQLLHSPMVSLSKKIVVLTKVLDSVAPQMVVFLQLVVKNRREKALKNILLVFQRLYRKKNGIIKSQIESAAELGKETKIAFENYLGKTFEKSVQMEFTVNPSIIGGFIITIEDNLLDKSIKWELEKLRRKLTGIEH
jgi:F-type H+-transporting ATPase subunit delta